MDNIKLLENENIEVIIINYIKKQAAHDINSLRKFLFSFNNLEEFKKVAKLGVFLLNDKKKPFSIKD